MTRYIMPLMVAATLVTAVGCQDSDVPTGTSSTPAQSTEATAPQTTTPSPADMQGASIIPGQYIVVLKDDVPATGLSKSAASLATSTGATIAREYTSTIKGFVAKMSPDEAEKMKADPQVKYIEPDYRVQLSPIAAQSDGMVSATSIAQIVPWGVTKVGGSRDGTGKTAWIVDTGIDLTNPDLNVDATRSRNFVADGHTNANDGNGHGTHVAGIIGAKNNSIDVVGVAANATLIAVRVLGDDGSGTYSAMIAGMDYVAANARAGDVMNMSLGGPASTALDDAVRKVAYRGVKVAIAAGNSSINANNTSPARVNAYNVYTVSAVDRNNMFASFSNYGNPPIDVAAPGVQIPSTARGGGAVYMSGTSMASPHVAGLLLFGTIHGYGWASGDPDGYADPVAYR